MARTRERPLTYVLRNHEQVAVRVLHENFPLTALTISGPAPYLPWTEMALSRQLYRAHIDGPRLATSHAAATAYCHSAVASARKIRSVDREIRWR